MAQQISLHDPGNPEPRETPPKATLWQRLLALFVLYHLAAVAAGNVPGPTSFRPELLDTDTGRLQIAAAAAGLRGVGVSLSDGEARALVLRWAPRLVALRKALLWPFAPYHDLVGAHQPWRLFAFVDRDASSMEIDALIDGEYRPLYRPLDPRHRWRAAQLDHERFRSILASATASPGYRAYPPFAAWVAARVFDDFPGAQAARLRVWKIPMIPPGASEPPGPGSYSQEIVLPRPALSP